MQTEPNAKQQIVEKIKNSTNILVTVGNNPSVDELSAALGLTLMLNRLDKHATAVFSGAIPPAINFLEPGKTFENTVDSLRDFIIALDKEKADRLRYKVEDDVVRIFITPYRTIISEQDLKFSQGDFNVDLIVALGVEKREDLDAAITAHGRILHDATAVTINTDNNKSSLGSIDWSDAGASSLCEMLMSLSEALQSGLLDEQIATAILTGIVAATDRFRNEHTSPKVMTMAAQLMAAGANQQLIAAKLEEGHELAAVPAVEKDGSKKLEEDKSQKVSEAKADDGSLAISHTPPPAEATPTSDPSSDALKEAETELAKSLENTAAPATPTLSVNDLQSDLAEAAKDMNDAAGIPTVPVQSEQGLPPLNLANDPIKAADPKIIKQERSWRTEPTSEPTFGGTLSATTSDAEEEKREEALSHTNHQILTHDEPAQPTPPADEPVSLEPPVFEPASVAPPIEPPQVPVKPLESTDDEALSFEPAPITHPETTLADLDDQTRGKDEEAARAAVDAALSAMPFNPAGKPLDSAGAVPGLSIDHDGTMTTHPPETSPTDQPTPSVTPVPPALPPLPDFSTLPPLPGEEELNAPIFIEPPTTDTPPSLVPDLMPPATPASDDPGQFKIPGQP